MNTKLIGVIIAASIAILMSGSVLMPVINDAVDDSKVYYNNDFGVLSAVADEPVNYRIEYTGNASGFISECYVENEKVATVYQGLGAIIIADSYVLVQQTNLTTWALYMGNNVESGSMFPLMTSDISVVLTKEKSTFSFTDGDGVQTVEIPTEWCYYRDDNSDEWRIVDYTTRTNKAYINDPSQVKGSLWSGVTSDFITFDGYKAEVFGTNAQIVDVSFDGYKKEMDGVYSFDVGGISGGQRSEGINFTIMYNGTPVELNPYYFVIPNKVYGQTETSETYTALLYAIPVILLTAIVATIALMFARRY